MTVVGGKLTTYRRMAEDAVDAALARTAAARPAPAAPGTCRCSAPRSREALARVDAPARLVRRYGAEAPALLAHGRCLGLRRRGAARPGRRRPAHRRRPSCSGASRHEGALDVDDLLDRRTRIGLVPADRVLAEPAAEQALAAHA